MLWFRLARKFRKMLMRLRNFAELGDLEEPLMVTAAT